MNKYIQYIQTELQKAPKRIDPDFNPERYIGTKHKYLGISTLPKREIAKRFLINFPDITSEDFFETIDSLFKGESFEEKTLAAEILVLYKKYFSELTPKHFKNWLSELEGWCEIDTLCQSTFGPNFFLTDWDKWEKMFETFSKSKKIQHRRASIVLLCKSIRESDDVRFRDTAIKNVEILKSEKDILITKAISWVLREMTKHHKEFIHEYIDTNESSLPKIAVRETRRKLLTGKK